jgi:hypothetical protein
MSIPKQIPSSVGTSLTLQGCHDINHITIDSDKDAILRDRGGFTHLVFR